MLQEHIDENASLMTDHQYLQASELAMYMRNLRHDVTNVSGRNDHLSRSRRKLLKEFEDMVYAHLEACLVQRLEYAEVGK